jgi:quercetin dioxygenase-like cupin family protein
MYRTVTVRSVARATGLCCTLFFTPMLHAQSPADAVVERLLTEPIPEYAGHELSMLTVTYPPGGSSKPHRHDAYILVYVLEGAVEMQVQGGPLRTVHAGETFVEHPADIHEVSRNASKTRPARFLVVALKESSRPLTSPPRAP